MPYREDDPRYYQEGGKLPSMPTTAELAAFFEANDRAVARQRAIEAHRRQGVQRRRQAEAERQHTSEEEILRREQAAERLAYAVAHCNDDYDLVHEYQAQEQRKKEWKDWVPGIARAQALNDELELQAHMGDILAKKHAAQVDWDVKSVPVPFESVKFIPNSGEGRFTGYAATYDLDLTGDIIVPGAFKDSLAASRARGGRMLMPLLFGHDMNLPIGGIVDAREDAKGLHIEGLIDLDTDIGRQAYSAAKKEYMSGLSIGYKVGRSEYDRDGNRRLKAIKLHEVSLVVMPANPAAGVTGFSS